MERTYATERGTVTRTSEQHADAGPPLIRWGAIFGGLVLGLAIVLLFTTLWFALAYGSEVDVVARNLDWFIGGTAIAALFVAGILTGYLAGVRGAGTGMLHAFTLWGLLLVLAITVGIPSLLNLFNLGRIATEVTAGTALLQPGADTAMWATFWTVLGGFVAAGLGGAIGGAMSPGRDAIVTSTHTEVRRDPDALILDRDDAPVVVRDDDSTARREVSEPQPRA